MKYTKKTLFVTVGLLFLVLFYFLFKYIFAGSLSWKEYSNPEVNFTFKYPSSWYVCEEFYKNLNERFIHISDKSIDCTNISFSDNSKYLTIHDAGERTSDIDAKIWLDKANEKDEEYEKRNLDSGGLPSAGGSSREFVRNVEGLFWGQKTNSIIEIKGFGDYPEFITINNSNVYTFKFSPMTGLESQSLRLILKTLKFK